MTSMSQARAAKAAVIKLLDNHKGVAGVGIGWDATGNPIVLVNVAEAVERDIRVVLPDHIGATAIHIEPIGNIIALTHHD